jgi:bifunctional DNase/RNase
MEPVTVLLDSVAFQDGYSTTAIILREKNGPRVFVLPGDYYTAAAVSQSVQKSERPGSHQTMAMLIDACGASLQEATIDYCDERGHYHTSVSIETGRGVQTVDLRPSDALALSLACRVPFRVNSALFCESGFGS